MKKARLSSPAANSPWMGILELNANVFGFNSLSFEAGFVLRGFLMRLIDQKFEIGTKMCEILCVLSFEDCITKFPPNRIRVFDLRLCFVFGHHYGVCSESFVKTGIAAHWLYARVYANPEGPEMEWSIHFIHRESPFPTYVFGWVRFKELGMCRNFIYVV